MTATDQKPPQRRTIIIIVAVLAGLLLVVTGLLVALLARGTDTPSAAGSTSPTPSDSATPSPTPSESPTPSPTPSEDAPPPPPSNDTKINSFTVSNSTVQCNSSAPAGSEQYISFSWNTSNVNQVYFGVETSDASQAPFFDNLPPSGTSQNDFPPGYNDFQYPCPNATTKYTLTVVGPTGKVSKSLTVTNTGDR